MLPSALNRIMPWAWATMGLLALVTLTETPRKFLTKIGDFDRQQYHRSGRGPYYARAGMFFPASDVEIF
jgi:hypothetical protein